ncbi:hypothetical protein ACFLY9_02435, partial [Patescibacteria group bacterium]
IKTTLREIESLRRLFDSILITALRNSDVVDFKVILSVNNTKEKKWKEVIKELKADYDDLKIEYVYTKDYKGLYPRVAGLKNALKKVENSSNSFIWYVDDDDFMFPLGIKYFPFMLHKDYITIGDTCIFEEEWDSKSSRTIPKKTIFRERVCSENYFKNILGMNHIHNCAMIFPTSIIFEIFNKYELRGDYTEDYMIFLHAYSQMNVIHYPVLIAGVSFHKTNTVLEINRNTTHWDYSYVTFMSEVVNSGFMRSGIYDYIRYSEDNIKKLFAKNQLAEKEYRKLEREVVEFIGFKEGQIWKALEKYRRVKGRVKADLLKGIIKGITRRIIPRYKELISSSEESVLYAEFIQCKDIEKLRIYQALWLLGCGYNKKEVSNIVGLSSRFTNKIIKVYKQSGLEGIKNFKKI